MTVYTYSFEQPSFGTYNVIAPQGFVLDESGSIDMARAMSTVLGLPQQTVQVRGNLGVYTINRVSAVGGDLTSRVQSAARFNVTIEPPRDSSAIFAQTQREAAEIEALARQLAEDVAAEPPGAALPPHDDAAGSSLVNRPGPGRNQESSSNPSASASNAKSTRRFSCGICTDFLKAGKLLFRRNGRCRSNTQTAFKRTDHAWRHMRDVHDLQDSEIVKRVDDDGNTIFWKRNSLPFA